MLDNRFYYAQTHLTANASVTARGSPSGTATTKTVMERMKNSSNFSNAKNQPQSASRGVKTKKRIDTYS